MFIAAEPSLRIEGFATTRSGTARQSSADAVKRTARSAEQGAEVGWGAAQSRLPTDGFGSAAPRSPVQAESVRVSMRDPSTGAHQGRGSSLMSRCHRARMASTVRVSNFTSDAAMLSITCCGDLAPGITVAICGCASA